MVGETVRPMQPCLAIYCARLLVGKEIRGAKYDRFKNVLKVELSDEREAVLELPPAWSWHAAVLSCPPWEVREALGWLSGQVQEMEKENQ